MSREPNNTQKPAKKGKPDTIVGYNGMQSKVIFLGITDGPVLRSALLRWPALVLRLWIFLDKHLANTKHPNQQAYQLSLLLSVQAIQLDYG